MKYYKIQHGFGKDDYLPITSDELPKAIAIFMQGNGRALFQEGAIRGQDIMRIVPDWHRVRGWNKGYQMTPEDYAEVKDLDESFRRTYQKCSMIAEASMKENRPELLKMPAKEAYEKLFPTLETSLSEERKLLAEKMKFA